MRKNTFFIAFFLSSWMLFGQDPDCVQYEYDAQGNRITVLYHNVCPDGLTQLQRDEYAMAGVIADGDSAKSRTSDNNASALQTDPSVDKEVEEGAKALLNGAFRVYPNPARTFLNLLCTERKPFEYTILDLNGKVLLQGEAGTGKISVDVSSLSSGNYQALIKQGEESKVYKLIIE